MSDTKYDPKRDYLKQVEALEKAHEDGKINDVDYYNVLPDLNAISNLITQKTRKTHEHQLETGLKASIETTAKLIEDYVDGKVETTFFKRRLSGFLKDIREKTIG